MSRFARVYRVIYWEEPVFVDEASPRLDLHSAADNITIATPVLPTAANEIEVNAFQHSLLDDFFT